MASENADEDVNRGTGGPDGTNAAQGADGSGASADQPVDPKVSAALAAAEAAGPAAGETVRIDSWIWAVRLVKTRSLGAAACRGGHLHVNGERVKPAHSVHIGDEVRLRHEGRERVVIVKRLIRKRVGAPVAAQCYIDNSPPPPPREAVAPAGLRDRGAGRPTKRDRRDMDRLRGLADPAATGRYGFAGLGGLASAAGSGGAGSSSGPGGPGGRGGPGGAGASRGSGGSGASHGSGGAGGSRRSGGPGSTHRKPRPSS
ncbi:RNA-binding S4 domain-containing protein [Streptomyces sp. NPDC040750]|uniref:RNA-binding S4 domain-containing protein n=1 Tax=Streptomyces sp. NPDC040750 TaxID=3154491 RepID=UPI0033D6A93A